jgi:hypothetical protein
LKKRKTIYMDRFFCYLLLMKAFPLSVPAGGIEALKATGLAKLLAFFYLEQRCRKTRSLTRTEFFCSAVLKESFFL